MVTDGRNKKVFEYRVKLDLFPSDFFNGNWFYLRTVVEAGETDSNDIGHQFFEAAHLVEFKKSSQHLEVVDASGYDLEEKDRVAAFFIPIQWKDYEIDSDASSFSAIYFHEKESEHKKDIDRPYFSIDFNKLVEIERSQYPSAKFKIRRLLVTDDSFNFDLEVNQTGGLPIVIKYSFKQVFDNPNYPQKQWYEADSTQFFPVFYVRRRYHQAATDFTKQDREKFNRVTRFDPNSEEIVWYFSTQTPKDPEIRDFARKAIEMENKAFQEAGKNSGRTIRIVLDESEDKELGDLRYNIINFIVTKSQVDTWFGFGPNVSNPITGEIVSSTANIWVSSIEHEYIAMVRQYVRLHIWPPLWRWLPSSPGLSDFTHEKIQKLCPEVKDFIATHKGHVPLHPTSFLLEDKKIQLDCGKKIAHNYILYSTIHEIRHGLGFRHVFSASADKENYYRNLEEITDIFGDSFSRDVTKSYQSPPKYSSVMDYGDKYSPALTVPGKYDIAATRYLYFDEIETVNDEGDISGALQLSSGEKSILQTSKKKGIGKDSLKKYRVCGGRRQDVKNSDFVPGDSLCLAFDRGSSRKEIITDVTRRVKDALSHLRRYDSDSLNEMDLTRIMLPLAHGAGYMMRTFNRWIQLRDDALKSIGKNVMEYSSLNKDDIKEYDSFMQSVAASNPEFRDHYEAVPLIKDLFVEMYFMPAKFCVFKTGKSYAAHLLEYILKEVESNYTKEDREVLIDCKSPIVTKWAEKEGFGGLLTEVGSLLGSRSYFIHPLPEDPVDEYSAYAFKTPFLQRIYDILIYEPSIREVFFQKLSDLVVNGQNLNSYLDKKQVRSSLGLDESDPLPELPRFSRFKDLVHTVPEGVKPQFGDLMNLRGLSIKVMSKSQSERVKSIVMNRFGVRFITPTQLQTTLSDLIERGRETEEITQWKMAQSFEHGWPFIYKQFLKYVEDYESKDPESQLAFTQWLRKHLSVSYIKSEDVLFMPRDEGDNIFIDLLRQYNEYKNCLGLLDCEDRADKKAFVQVIDNLAYIIVP